MKVLVKFDPKDGLSKANEKTLQVERFWVIDAAKEAGVDRDVIQDVKFIRAFRLSFDVQNPDGNGFVVVPVEQEAVLGFVKTGVKGVVAVMPSWKKGGPGLREDEYLQNTYYITPTNNGFQQNSQLFVELEVVV